MTASGVVYRLVPLSCDNYETALSLCVAPEQERWVGTVAEAIAHAHFDANKHLLAIYRGDEMIGFAMYTLTSTLGTEPPSCRISRFLIHCTHQGQGHGRRTFRLLIAYILARHPNVVMHILVSGSNTVARRLYEGAGFVFGADKPVDRSLLRYHSSVAAQDDVWLGVFSPSTLLSQ